MGFSLTVIAFSVEGSVRIRLRLCYDKSIYKMLSKSNIFVNMDTRTLVKIIIGMFVASLVLVLPPLSLIIPVRIGIAGSLLLLHRVLLLWHS